MTSYALRELVKDKIEDLLTVPPSSLVRFILTP